MAFLIVAVILVGGSLALSFVKINGGRSLRSPSPRLILLEAADVCVEARPSGRGGPSRSSTRGNAGASAYRSHRFGSVTIKLENLQTGTRRAKKPPTDNFWKKRWRSGIRYSAGKAANVRRAARGLSLESMRK